MAKRNRKLSLLILPASAFRSDRLAISGVALLVLSALLVLAAAWAMPPEYSWRSHSISESAAQGQTYAWIARLSFLCFGAAVVAISIALRDAWPRPTYWCGLTFAGSMFGVAAFSHAPWQPGSTGDAQEDFLHSVFATGMGFAFVLGVIIRFIHRIPRATFARVLDIVAVLIATALPLMFVSSTTAGGAVQRIMFFVGYIWFGREAIAGRN